MTTEIVNFGNLRSQFFNKETYSDLVLHISDLANPTKPPLVIHSHFIVLYSASEYIRRRLDSSSLFQNDPSRFQVNHQTHLKLSLTSFDDEVVRLFFSLFYVNRFDNEHLAQSGIGELVHENLLTLYEMAQYFLFDTLLAYIEQYIRETMCLSYMTPLLEYCLQENPQNGNHYIDQSRSGALFNSFIQWYSCCADVKEDAVSAITGRVENLDNCCKLPRKRVQRLSDETTYLEYYLRICDDCMCKSSKRNTVGAYYYLSVGSLTLGREQFFMRLKKRLDNKNKNNTIELTRRKDNIDNAATSDETLRCHSRISILSRKKQKEAPLRSIENVDLLTPTEINNFETPSLKHCYEARCDHCTLNKPVYIFLIDITLTENNNNGPVEENMNMSVEETMCL